jgi:hypothetical protein
VLFNGATSTVISATASTLAGDGAGRRVDRQDRRQVGANSATSAQDFTIIAAGAPTITSFAPVVGSAGTVVTVSGANFNPAAGATMVNLNQSTVTLTSVTPTQLAFAVPTATGSGKLRVATAVGAAVSVSISSWRRQASLRPTSSHRPGSSPMVRHEA